MDKTFNKKNKRQNSEERKWSKEYLAKNYSLDLTKRFYNLSIADLDFETPKPIVRSIIKRAKRKTFSYTYVKEETTELIVEWYKKLHQVNVNKNLIKLAHGTVNAMFEVVKCFTNIDDWVLIQSPIYQPFERSIIKTKRKVAYNKLIYKDNDYFIDYEDLEIQIRAKNIKVFLWCNPHNPSGRVWKDSEILKIIDICNKNNVLLFSDEVHGDLILTQQHNSLLKYKDKINNFIVCNSPNKAFNLGGLKGSYIICSNNEILEIINRQYENDSLTSPNVFYQPALIAAYKDITCFKWLTNLKKHILKNYSFLIKELENYNDVIEIVKMPSSYLLWIKSKKNLKSEQLRAMFSKENLILTYADEFADCQEGWFRVNIGVNKNDLKKITIKIKNVLDKIRSNIYEKN